MRLHGRDRRQDGAHQLLGRGPLQSRVQRVAAGSRPACASAANCASRFSTSTSSPASSTRRCHNSEAVV